MAEKSDQLTLGNIAYNAYCTTTNWKSLISGQDLPSFGQNKPEIQDAWEKAAQAVAGAVGRADAIAAAPVDVQSGLGEAKPKFVVGDVVTLKSRGPNMTVCSGPISDGDGQTLFFCKWFSADNSMEGHFHESSIEIVPATQVPGQTIGQIHDRKAAK